MGSTRTCFGSLLRVCTAGCSGVRREKGQRKIDEGHDGFTILGSHFYFRGMFCFIPRRFMSRNEMTVRQSPLCPMCPRCFRVPWNPFLCPGAGAGFCVKGVEQTVRWDGRGDKSGETTRATCCRLAANEGYKVFVCLSVHSALFDQPRVNTRTPFRAHPLLDHPHLATPSFGHVSQRRSLSQPPQIVQPITDTKSTRISA